MVEQRLLLCAPHFFFFFLSLHFFQRFASFFLLFLFYANIVKDYRDFPTLIDTNFYVNWVRHADENESKNHLMCNFVYQEEKKKKQNWKKSRISTFVACAIWIDTCVFPFSVLFFFVFRLFCSLLVPDTVAHPQWEYLHSTGIVSKWVSALRKMNYVIWFKWKPIEMYDFDEHYAYHYLRLPMPKGKSPATGGTRNGFRVVHF